MPLLDHFHPPLSGERHWESFHAAWAGSIADQLNRDLLPGGYFAEEHVHVGSRVEIDVATFEGGTSSATAGGTVAVAARPYTPPRPVVSWPSVFPDSLEVLVYSSEGGPTLVAAIELVSPANKDRPETRRAFVAKCAAHLQQGVGLIVIDIVTSRSANLHRDLAEFLGAPAATVDRLYAVAYKPVRLTDDDRIDVWPATLTLGQALPTLPLALDKGGVVPVDFDSSYRQACERRRLREYPRPVG